VPFSGGGVEPAVPVAGRAVRDFLARGVDSGLHEMVACARR
jgi:hypothetical protein